MKKFYIEVGGTAYPCRLTMGAMLQFKRMVGRDVSQIDVNDIEEMLTLMWCCIESASRADHVEFDVEFQQFCDLIGPEDLTKWNAKMADAYDEKKSEEES